MAYYTLYTSFLFSGTKTEMCVHLHKPATARRWQEVVIEEKEGRKISFVEKTGVLFPSHYGKDWESVTFPEDTPIEEWAEEKIREGEGEKEYVRMYDTWRYQQAVYIAKAMLDFAKKKKRLYPSFFKIEEDPSLASYVEAREKWEKKKNEERVRQQTGIFLVGEARRLRKEGDYKGALGLALMIADT